MDDLKLQFETDLVQGGLLDDSPLHQETLAEMTTLLGGVVATITLNIVSHLITEIIKKKYLT